MRFDGCSVGVESINNCLKNYLRLMLFGITNNLRLILFGSKELILNHSLKLFKINAFWGKNN